MDTDGWYGNQTEQAVKDFQKQSRLPQTRVVDERTYGSLLFAANQTHLADHLSSSAQQYGDKLNDFFDLISGKSVNGNH